MKPDDANVYYQIGMLYQKIKQYKKAFQNFEKAVEIDPEAMDAFYQIGRTGVFSGENLDRSIESLKKYLLSEPKPGHPGHDAAHWRLGMLYEKDGKLNLAIHEYETALQLNPKEEKYKSALSKIKK